MFRQFVERFGRSAVLYIKRKGYISPQGAAKLVDDGLVSFIKYAIVRDDPADDPFLTQLVDQVDRSIIVSGIGEQPAIVHLKQFGLTGFTSGCVCVAPALSQQMLVALNQDDTETAESIRQTFEPLEDLPADEFKLAKQKLIAAHSQRNVTPSSQAFQAAIDELYGLGYDNDKQYDARIEKVTVENVQDLIKKYFQTPIIATSAPAAE